MKIIYAAGNRIGSDIQLKRFLKHNKHEIKIAAYLRSSGSLTNVDWLLDAARHNKEKRSRKNLANIFGYKSPPWINPKVATTLLDDVCLYNPDLIIADFEPIFSNIAKTLGIKLWYCSPVHLLDGIKWEGEQLKYFSLLDKTRRGLSRLPKAEKTFIYSPFGDKVFKLKLKREYEWVKPYYYDIGHSKGFEGIVVIRDPERISILSKIFNCVSPFNFTLFSPFSYNLSHLESQNISNVESYKVALSNCIWMFTTGETSFLADVIYNGVNRICISPNLSDPEALLNASLCSYYNIGNDLGQVELMGRYATEEIEKSYNNFNKFNKLDGIDLYLHEKIEEIDFEKSSI